MGDEASLKDKGSAADLPMLDKETLPLPRAPNTHSPTYRKFFLLLIFPDEGHFYRNLKATVPCQSL